MNATTTKKHPCARCNRNLPEARDQASPQDNEVTMDTAQIVVLTPDWVCGACIDLVESIEVWDRTRGNPCRWADLRREVREEIVDAIDDDMVGGDIIIGGVHYRWNLKSEGA